ncbi:hypothetical protein Tco_1546376, partial [Tanacetum coccineum]
EKNKHYVHAISIIDFLRDDPFSGSTTIHLEEFVDELTLLKKDIQEGNFQDHSNPLFEFNDNFKSSPINALFDEMEEDKTEIDAFLAMEVSSNFEEGYFDSEGDVTFLDNLLSDDIYHNLSSEVISDHEPEQNESSITFSPRSDLLHHEFADEILTLPSRNDREFGEYLSLMTVLCEISISQSQENVHANQSSIIESLPISPIPVEDSEPAQEEIDIFLVPDDLIPPGVENDDSENEDNELPNLDHQDDPSIPRPPPEPPDVEKCFEPEVGTDKTKNHKKTVKNGQTRIREWKSVQEPEAKDDSPMIDGMYGVDWRERVEQGKARRGARFGRAPKDLTGLSLISQSSRKALRALCFCLAEANCEVKADLEQVLQSKDNDSPNDVVNDVAPLDSDPFGLDSLINQKCGKVTKVKYSETLEFPLGFPPTCHSYQQGNPIVLDHTGSESIHKQLNEGSHKQSGFSILERLEETIKVGLALGLNIEGCENTLSALITKNGDVMVNK